MEQNTRSWEERFDSAYISGELEIDVPGANGVPLKSLKTFIAKEIQEAEARGREKAVDFIESKMTDDQALHGYQWVFEAARTGEEVKK